MVLLVGRAINGSLSSGLGSLGFLAVINLCAASNASADSPGRFVDIKPRISCLLSFALHFRQ